MFQHILSVFLCNFSSVCHAVSSLTEFVRQFFQSEWLSVPLFVCLVLSCYWVSSLCRCVTGNFWRVWYRISMLRCKTNFLVSVLCILCKWYWHHKTHSLCTHLHNYTSPDTFRHCLCLCFTRCKDIKSRCVFEYV